MVKHKFLSGLQRRYKNKIIQDTKNILKYIYYFYTKNIYILDYKDLDNYMTSRKLKRQIKLLLNSETLDIYNFVNKNKLLFTDLDRYIDILFTKYITVSISAISNEKNLEETVSYKSTFRKTLSRLRKPNDYVLEIIGWLSGIEKEFKLETNYELQNLDNIADNRKQKKYNVLTLNSINWTDNARRNMYVFGALIGRMGYRNMKKITHTIMRNGEAFAEIERNAYIEYIRDLEFYSIYNGKNNAKPKRELCKMSKREKNTIEDLLGKIS